MQRSRAIIPEFQANFFKKKYIMTDTATSIETLFEKAQDYSKTSLELLKLNAIAKSSDVTSTLMARLIIFMVVALSVMIMNIGIAFWISDMLGKDWYGFFIVGIFHAFVALLLFIFRHQWIKDPIHNAIIRKIQNQEKVPV
jgi:phosphoglycerol transferase MdoB-like AlkP superfamily enzyme